MAAFESVAQAMVAVEALLRRDLPQGATAQLLSSRFSAPQSNQLGLWVHRLTVDTNGRNRYLASDPSGGPPRPELPINIHFLLISWGDSGESEIGLHAYGMRQLASNPQLGASHIQAGDWEDDEVQIVPEEMATEDLLRIWDALPTDYSLSSSWVLRTVRIALPADELSPVTTRVVKVGKT